MSIREEYLYLTNSGKDNKEAIERLAEIIALLRHECPWDKVQTHETLRKGMIEEAYEVVEAINNKDMANLREELGDVLLQVLFPTDIEQDAGRFTLDDVCDTVCKKLVFRHPFLFGGENPGWDELKKREKGQQTVSETLDAVARSLPALWRSEKLQKKAAKTGFSWESAEESLDKLDEETAELRRAVETGQDAEEELGDVLFAAVSAAIRLNADPEQALHRTCEKFIRRFGAMEQAAADAGRSLSELTRDELLALWALQKQAEHSKA